MIQGGECIPRVRIRYRLSRTINFLAVDMRLLFLRVYFYCALIPRNSVDLFDLRLLFLKLLYFIGGGDINTYHPAVLFLNCDDEK